MSEHEHKWATHMHLDGCHFWQTVLLCSECGDTKVVGGERNFHDVDDPYAAVWMVDDCPRCQALWKGAAPKESLA